MEYVPMMDGRDFAVTGPGSARTVQGFRKNLTEVLDAAFPKSKAERRGFLTALAALKAQELPSAFVRSTDVWQIQIQLNRAWVTSTRKYDAAYPARQTVGA